jgi:hypothetical protein
MSNPADMELRLRRRDAHRHSVELRVSAADSQVETLRVRSALKLDAARLAALYDQPEAYGRLLSETLFADERLAAVLAEVRRDSAQIRLRLAVPADDGELQAVRWELLHDPSDARGRSLAAAPDVLFSRYLDDPGAQWVRLRARGGLRALVVVAGPADLVAHALPALDVADEARRIRAGLQPIEPTVLGTTVPATREAIERELREGYDIVVVLAHHRVLDDAVLVYLEDEQRATRAVPSSDLTDIIAALEERPSLAIMVAPQSAPPSDLSALAIVGPQLAYAGVPGVLALQSFTATTAGEEHLPLFFKALHYSGQLDRALAEARRTVDDSSWTPVLFTRLRSGRLWYVPSFSGIADQTGTTKAGEKWGPLRRSILNGKCTPILGPDLLGELVGSHRELARVLADRFNFPLAPHDREGLTQVAQFISVNNRDQQFAQTAIVQVLCELLRRRHGRSLPSGAHRVELDLLPDWQLLPLFDEWLVAAWTAEQELDPAEPYRMLAALRLPIYVTADPSSLLLHALRRAGSEPHEMFAPWNEAARALSSPYAGQQHRPTPRRPLVYRLFGSFAKPETRVFTEDSYFDYLIGVSQDKDRIPKLLRYILTDTSLMFMGFRPDDWAFRVFFRTLVAQAGGVRRAHHPHVAVQVAPEEGRTLLPQLAQRYFEQYFAVYGVDVNVYWGDATDFSRALHERSPYPPRDNDVDAVPLPPADVFRSETALHSIDPVALRRLRTILTGRFDEHGLRALAFDLGIDYDSDLAGETKDVRVISLITYLRQRGRLDELFAIGKLLRDDIPWDSFLRSTS